ncbi:putative toxin-antitoxin system toxin component, PIN family [Coleofasciculus sp. F4-SAH-05]|uniref:putative toxin-antitoxin system toxin component, PIN family n=1 Tax=Coleofasciculus sp. F4-SAH-05 TaxID=3069525 RepID=UPI0033013031
MNPDLIVIDTNIFISAVLSPNGTAYQAFSKAIKHFTIVHTDQTYQELAQRIYKPKFDKYISNQRREDFLARIRNNSQFSQTTLAITDCRDPDDNKLLAPAQEKPKKPSSPASPKN